VRRRAERAEQASRGRAEQREATHAVLVDDHVLADWLLPQVKGLGLTFAKWTPPGAALKALIAVAKQKGLVGDAFSSNAAKEFIKAHVRARLR
jgi:hypothetical protein